MTDGKLGAVLRSIQPLFLLAAGAFIVYLIQSQWGELRAYPWRLHGAWFALATVLLLITWTLEVWIWQILLARLGGRLPMFSAMRIWFQSAIVRYIPGNVWQPLSLTYLCYRQGVRAETTMASVILYQVITLLGTLPFATLYLMLESEDKVRAVLGVIPRWLPTGLALAPLFIFVINPMWLMHGINWLLRKVRRAPITSSLTRGGLLYVFFITVVNWLMWGMTFAALTFSLGNYSTAQILDLGLHLTIIYPLAYAIGFISFFTPSGFGVREGALMLFLAPFLPVAVVTVIALAMRVWTMAGELMLAGIAALWERRFGAVPAIQWRAANSAARPAPSAPQTTATVTDKATGKVSENAAQPPAGFKRTAGVADFPTDDSDRSPSSARAD